MLVTRVLAAAAGALLLAGAPASAADGRWEKAVALAGAGADWAPGESITRTEVKSGSGKVLTVEEVWTEYRPGPDGKAESHVVRAVKDGEDITADRKARVEARRAKDGAGPSEDSQSMSVNLADHPFSASAQPQVTATPREETKTVGGEACARYDYVMKKAGTVYRGTAWLSQNTGAPLEIQYSMDPLPKSHNRMQLTARYQLTGDGRWLIEELTTEGGASLLFVKRNYRAVSSFAKHWKVGAR